MLPYTQSFRLVGITRTTAPLLHKPDEIGHPHGYGVIDLTGGRVQATPISDEHRRTFLRALGIVGLGAVGASLLPGRTEALVMGGAPSTGVVGVRDSSNTRVNPAIKEGTGILKKTIALTSSGTVHTPASGKRVRVYNNRFSLTADMTSISFRFTSGGTDYEKYLTPKAGGLYGANNQPNYMQGGIDEVLYCAISGTGTVQINLDYVEV